MHFGHSDIMLIVAQLSKRAFEELATDTYSPLMYAVNYWLDHVVSVLETDPLPKALQDIFRRMTIEDPDVFKP